MPNGKLLNHKNIVNCINSDCTLTEMVKGRNPECLMADDLMGVIMGLLIRSQPFSPSTDPRFNKITPEEWAKVVSAAADTLGDELDAAMFTFVHECETFLESTCAERSNDDLTPEEMSAKAK